MHSIKPSTEIDISTLHCGEAATICYRSTALGVPLFLVGSVAGCCTSLKGCSVFVFHFCFSFFSSGKPAFVSRPLLSACSMKRHVLKYSRSFPMDVFQISRANICVVERAFSMNVFHVLHVNIYVVERAFSMNVFHVLHVNIYVVERAFSMNVFHVLHVNIYVVERAFFMNVFHVLHVNIYVVERASR